jgi:dihydrofolate reductase
MLRLGIIVAATNCGRITNKLGIGKDGKIPWYYKEDLKRFKDITKHNPILMGRKTWESLPIQPLPDRFNIVLTKNIENINEINKAKNKPDLICSSPEEAIKYCIENKYKRVWIIGGEQIYRLFMEHPLLDKILITIVADDVECDTFFPKVPLSFTDLRIESSKLHKGVDYLTYSREINEEVLKHFDFTIIPLSSIPPLNLVVSGREMVSPLQDGFVGCDGVPYRGSS